MKMKRISVPGACAALLAIAVAGCGGGGGSSGASSTPTPVPSGTVSGVAGKGLLLNAIVSFYSVSDGVASTTAITSVRTDAKTGAFSATVASAGPVVVTVTTDSSTQMLDEISGTAITAPSGLILHSVFDGVTNLQPISITPLTEIAYNIAKTSSGAITTTNIDAANNAVSTAFLAGAPVLYTQPIDISKYATATAAEQELAKLLTALSVAANEGIATGVSGSPCATTYSANIVCLISGLNSLVTINSSGAITLTAAANYISSAYTSIDTGTVTIDGGKLPSALGLNVTTAAETSFLTAIAKQSPLPGYDPGANPLANTKALFANIRTNIVDQATTETFGYAPTLSALQADYNKNVNPIASNTSSLLGSAYKAAQLIQFGTTSSATLGTPSPNILNPTALAADTSGNFYVVNSNATIAKVTTSGVSIYAGQSGVLGSNNGAAAQATFTFPNAIAVDSTGNAYVLDNDTIREITPAGIVSTLAGQAGVPGNTDGTGASATFDNPSAITVDSAGNIYVADDMGNGVIRLVSPGGVVTTLPIVPIDEYNPPFNGIAVDSSGNLYVTTESAIEEITPSGVVSVLAGQLSGGYGYVDGVGAAAQFAYLTAITIDGSGNLYVFDNGNSAIRKITQAGVVSTLAKTKTQNLATDSNSFGLITGTALDPSGNVYVADETHSSIQEVTPSGVITTLVHSVANYQSGCGYDPVGLNTAVNVALCRYGLKDGQILLTVTQSGTGTYTLQTQALTTSSQSLPNGPYNPIYSFLYSVNASYPALQSNFTWTTSASGAQSASFSGPYYVNSTGGRVQGTISAAESSDWNQATGTGSISLSGTLSGGTGGVSLVNATIGSDSVITLQNVQRLFTGAPVVSAGSPAVTISGVLDLTQFTTDAFSYAVKADIGAPIYDKSKALALPGTASVTGSITEITADGSIPLFSGSISASFEGLPSFDATKPISPTNYFTAQAQLTGTLSFTGGRVLTVTASANASQLAATPTQPDSISASYSYVTPSGTAELNATGQYDATNGYSGTITNNSGVVISVTDPIGGKLTGTVTANGTETATINGAFVYYSDGTSESLF
jgi:sugar lactone lactonase YvrE